MDEDIKGYSGYGFKPVTLTKLMKNAWKVSTVHQGKINVKLWLEYGLDAMVAWSWSELADYGGFAKEGVEDIDKDVSYNKVLWFNAFWLK